MHELEEHLKSLPSLKGKDLYVACSGGLDSMVLLSLIHKLHRDPIALHVNYGLRGEESDLDEQFVHAYCKERRIRFEVLHSDLSTRSNQNINIQLEARKERYEWFQKIIDEQPDSLILLAHHANDQVETFLMNLIRNSGVTGLAAMPEKHKSFLRPLLNFTKQDLLTYAQRNNIKWREDSSNQTLKYVRNSWRNEYLPFIEKSIPDIAESVLLLINKFQDLQNELEQKIRPLIAEIARTKFISDELYTPLDDLEKIEFWRQLGQRHTLIAEIERLSQKGKYILLLPNSFQYCFLIRETDGFSLLPSKLDLQLPDLLIDKVKNLPDEFDLNTLYLDAGKLSGQLHLRIWKKGDRIEPVGMKGSKLLSDILSDKKLNYHEKLQTLVLCDDAHIHWCPGVKIGRRALPDSDSKEILKITLRAEESPK